MQSPKYKRNYTDTYTVFNQILEIVGKLYKKCIPATIKNRKNVDKLVQPDTGIIACVLWGSCLVTRIKELRTMRYERFYSLLNFQAEHDTFGFVQI